MKAQIITQFIAMYFSLFIFCGDKSRPYVNLKIRQMLSRIIEICQGVLAYDFPKLNTYESFNYIRNYI
jgi:hypothetical protein